MYAFAVVKLIAIFYFKSLNLYLFDSTDSCLTVHKLYQDEVLRFNAKINEYLIKEIFCHSCFYVLQLKATNNCIISQHGSRHHLLFVKSKV